MQTPWNPYASPETPPDLVPDEAASNDASIFAWERLRLYYNAALLGVIGLAALPHIPRTGLYLPWGPVVVGMIAANFGFCAGPILEAYLVWIGANRKLARHVLFWLGLIASVIITGGSTTISFAMWNP